MGNLTKQAGVIGYPIGHSLSPKLHNFWIKSYNIDANYQAYEVRPDKLGDYIRSLPSSSMVGINVTAPHKEEVFRLIKNKDEAARRIGAINTLVVTDNGELIGYNTDAFGFIENIVAHKPEFDFVGKVAVILGAGGASRAVVTGVQLAGVEHVFLLNRTRERAQKLQKTLGGNIEVRSWDDRHSILSQADILINTTVLGMKGKEKLDIKLDLLQQNALVTDIVYQPLKTDLLLQAEKRGHPVVDGLGMLLYQAVPAFEKWFGIKPAVTEELRKIMV